MSTRTPPLQTRSQFNRSWGNFATAADLPNASGAPLAAPFFSILEVGDTAYSVADGATYTCTAVGTAGGGDAVWSSGGGGASGSALPLERSYVPVGAGSNFVTEVGVPTLVGSSLSARAFTPASLVYLERQLRIGMTTSTIADNSVAVWSSIMFAGVQRPRFRFTQAFGGSAFASARYLACLVDLASQMWAGSSEPSAQARSLVGVGFDSGDANLQVMHNDGAGVCSKIDLGAAFARAAELVVRVALDWGAPGQIDYEVTRLDVPATASGSLTLDIPADAVGLAYNTQTTNDGVGGNAANVDLLGFYANLPEA